jgi:hypothetical protein
MQRRQLIVLLTMIIFAGLSVLQGARAESRRTLVGKWVIDFKVPVSPKGNDFHDPHRHNFYFQEESGQCTVVVHEQLDVLDPGAWRQSGDDFSAAFELYCGTEKIDCATVLMRGHLDSRKEVSGLTVVIWDTRDETTPTGYDTATGPFTGFRCVQTTHDTGGCDHE